MWLIAVIIGLLSIVSCNETSRGRELPCHFLDSINITDGAMQSDKSIIFGGTTFNEDQYSLVDYKLDNGTQPIPIEPHLRGCLCNIKPCIRLCCPYGSIHQRLPSGGIGCQKQDTPVNFEKDIHVENSNVKRLLENHHFGYVIDRPCNKFYIAEDYTMTSVMKQIDWIQSNRVWMSLNLTFFHFQMGNILFENATVTHRHYCLKTTVNNETKEPTVNAVICFDSSDKLEVRHNILPYGKWIQFYSKSN